MNDAAQYILSVTAAAVLTAIVHVLAGSGTMGALVKLLGGLFMALTVLSPLVRLELPDLGDWLAVYAADGEDAAAAGEAMAKEASNAIIKEELEAYIMDKAALYGASLEVEVSLDEGGIPVSVTLTGAVSPYARTRLTQTIREDLGVGEEAQQWIE